MVNLEDFPPLRATSSPAQALPPAVITEEADVVEAVEQLTETLEDLSLQLPPVPIPSLPDEIWYYILSLLPNNDPDTSFTLTSFQRVSKRLASIASDRTLWKAHLDREFYPLNLCQERFPMFEVVNFEDPGVEYKRLKLVEMEGVRLLRRLVRAEYNRSQLLDELCQTYTATLGCVGALDRLADCQPEEDPEDWLTTRYWARIAAGSVRREFIIRLWSETIWSGELTRFPGREALNLAGFSAFTGGNFHQVVRDFASLNIKDLPDYSPTDRMSERELIIHVVDAFKAGGFDNRALHVETLFLQQIVSGAATAADFPPDPNWIIPPSPSSMLILLYFLLQVPRISSVWIMDTDTLFLCVTFSESSEKLFLEIHSGRILSLQEILEMYPDLDAEGELSNVGEEGVILDESCLMTSSLLESLDLLFESIFRAKYPSLGFQNALYDRELHTISGLEYGGWNAAQHLRLLRNIMDDKNLERIEIPCHNIFESKMLTRVYTDILTRLSATDTPKDVEVVPSMDEGYDFFKDDLHNSFRHFESYFQRKIGPDWFEIGCCFEYTGDGGATVVVVIGWECLPPTSRHPEFESNHDLLYLCLQLGSNRNGRVHTVHLRHSELCETVPLADHIVLHPRFQIGQFFRAWSTEGFLLPNEWMEGMMMKMDNSTPFEPNWFEEYCDSDDYYSYYWEDWYSRDGKAEEEADDMISERRQRSRGDGKGKEEAKGKTHHGSRAPGRVVRGTSGSGGRGRGRGRGRGSGRGRGKEKAIV